jgi:hypothetical protein
MYIVGAYTTAYNLHSDHSTAPRACTCSDKFDSVRRAGSSCSFVLRSLVSPRVLVLRVSGVVWVVLCGCCGRLWFSCKSFKYNVGTLYVHLFGGFSRDSVFFFVYNFGLFCICK